MYHPDNFSYIYEKSTPHYQRKKFATRENTAYTYDFGCKVLDKDKSWVPHVWCTVCKSDTTQGPSWLW